MKYLIRVIFFVLTAVQLFAESSGEIRLGGFNFRVDETRPMLDISVFRVGGANGPATVQYATADIIAQANLDYDPTSGTLTWENGDSTEKIISVPITDDVTIEGDENFRIIL